jgi:outer membrane lipopolysaccharide assembly protein LptE/RlpB
MRTIDSRCKTLWALALMLSILIACGYKVRSSVGKLPAGIQSIAVPTFKNHTAEYRIEQRITSALLKELASRTRIPVRSTEPGADAVLLGEIRSVNSNPVTYAADAFGSAFVVTVQVGVKLVRSSDRAVLWENSDFLFTERYVLTSKASNFFSEESPALDRLSLDFAASLTSTLLAR